jgi:hypothetical protein
MSIEIAVDGAHRDIEAFGQRLRCDAGSSASQVFGQGKKSLGSSHAT